MGFYCRTWKTSKNLLEFYCRVAELYCRELDIYCRVIILITKFEVLCLWSSTVVGILLSHKTKLKFFFKCLCSMVGGFLPSLEFYGRHISPTSLHTRLLMMDPNVVIIFWFFQRIIPTSFSWQLTKICWFLNDK